jgi:hypothetical protein
MKPLPLMSYYGRLPLMGVDPLEQGKGFGSALTQQDLFNVIETTNLS